MVTKQIRITEEVANLLSTYPGKSYSQKIAAMVLCLETLNNFCVRQVVDGVLVGLRPRTDPSLTIIPALKKNLADGEDKPEEEK